MVARNARYPDCLSCFVMSMLILAYDANDRAKARGLPRRLQLLVGLSLPVCVSPVIHREDRYDAFLLINNEEDSVVADSVPPGIGSVSLEFLDVGTQEGVSP